MNIQVAIQDFITVHEIDNGSPYTVRNCRAHLGRFAAWLQKEYGISDTDDLRIIHLRGWIAHLQKTPSQRGGGKLGDETIHGYGQTMLAFCHWLEREEVIEKPITTRFKLPRVEDKFIPTFTPDEVERLFAACEDGDSRWLPRIAKALTARNRAILSVFIDAGLRVSELVGLRLCDIDRDLRLLTVHRKGNKWQQVPISMDGFKPLHDYLAKHRKHLAKQAGVTVARKEDAVFLSDKGTPLTVDGVEMLFKRLKKRTGITGKRVSPHNCRRYMATTQLDMGRSPFDVQRQMGHSTLAMTNHYASLTTRQIKQSHERFSPLRAKDAGDFQTSSESGYWDE